MHVFFLPFFLTFPSIPSTLPANGTRNFHIQRKGNYSQFPQPYKGGLSFMLIGRSLNKSPWIGNCSALTHLGLG